MAAFSSFAIPAAISAGSSVLGSVLTDDPEVPDLSGQARDEVDRARREQREQAEEQRQNLEESLAARSASGLTSAGAREEMFDAQASASAELENRAAQIIQDAIRKERLMEFRNQRQEAQNRARAISSIGQGLGSAAVAADAGQNMDLNLPNFGMDPSGTAAGDLASGIDLNEMPLADIDI